LGKKVKNAKAAEASAATVGYEDRLWQMADALRGSMDAAEYKHVVLGLIFLKYISDAFEEQHAKLIADRKSGADPEDPDEYRALSIFWVPPEARWQHLKAQAKQPTIGQLVDDAMAGIERDRGDGGFRDRWGKSRCLARQRGGVTTSSATGPRNCEQLAPCLARRLVMSRMSGKV